VTAIRLAVAAVLILTAGPEPRGHEDIQAVDLSGTWQLDATRSRHTEAVALIGLVKTGAPATLHVTHAANGTVIVESHINESLSRMYKPGGRTATPVVPNGTITMTSRWDGRALVGEGTFESTAGSVGVRESLAVGADGQTLTIDVTTSGSADTRGVTLVYTRIKSVGSCRTWPTPCKL
jgi:hypothetical protein